MEALTRLMCMFIKDPLDGHFIASISNFILHTLSNFIVNTEKAANKLSFNSLNHKSSCFENHVDVNIHNVFFKKN